MGSTVEGQVFADTCLICNQQCFIRSHFAKPEIESKLTASRKKRSNFGPTPLEIRQSIYRAFDIGVNPEDVSKPTKVKASTLDLPLCGPCIFKVGQLRAIQSELTYLQRQYDKLREEIAFSIVDVVASNLNNSICTNIGDEPPSVLLRKLKEYEVGTLQQLVFEKWHEASYTDFEEDSEDARGESSAPERPSSSHLQLNAKSNGKVPGNRKLSTSSSCLTVTSSDLVSGQPGGLTKGQDRQSSSISITKVESGSTGSLAYENGQLQILDVEDEEGYDEEDSRFPGDIYADEETDRPESPPIPEELLLEDDDFDEDDLEGMDQLTFPFGLELAEYSSAIQDRSDVIYGGEDADEGEEELDNDPARQTVDPNQNLEIFRDKDGLYECQFCQKKFIHKYPFRDHLRVHFGDGPRCKICNKIFPKKHNLMLHLRTHSGEKPYVCTVCDKGFADKSNLKVHMRVHTGERPYKCEYCHVAFSNSSRLVVHKRTHTGEKPFTCDICNRKCTTRNQLSTHRKTHFQSGRNRIGIQTQ